MSIFLSTSHRWRREVESLAQDYKREKASAQEADPRRLALSLYCGPALSEMFVFLCGIGKEREKQNMYNLEKNTAVPMRNDVRSDFS